jgi:hypothetical protein
MGRPAFDTHVIKEGNRRLTQGDMETGSRKKSGHRPNRSKFGPFMDRAAANNSLPTDPHAKYKITKRTHLRFWTKDHPSTACYEVAQFPDKKRTHSNPFYPADFRSVSSWFCEELLDFAAICDEKK